MSKSPVILQQNQTVAPNDGNEETIVRLRDELYSHRQILLALSDLVYLQNQELSHLRGLVANTSLWTLFWHAIRRQPLKYIPAAQANSTIIESCYHPGIQVCLKKESLWRRYFTANSRRLRGKYHQKYEACIIAPAGAETPATDDVRMLAKQYTSILSQRGI